MATLQDSPIIAELSSQCWSRFSCTRSKFTLSGAPLPEGFEAHDFLDLFARFRMWAANLGALQREKSSLDHRLRNSELRMEVLRLLTELLAALTDLYPLVAGEKVQETWYYEDDDNPGEDFESDSSGSEPESASQSRTRKSEQPRILVTESAQLVLIIQDTVASLLKLSIVIHRSTRRAKFARSSKEKQYDTSFDIAHVEAVFPYAAQNRPLIERLGRANAQRRQWLAYRKRHHQRLATAAAAEPGGGILRDQHELAQTEVDSSVPGFSIPISSHRPTPSAPGDWEETEATTFYQESHATRGEDRGRDEGSETSYSASSSSELDNEHMLLPRPPAGSADGNPFECPFCFTIITIESLRSWVKHVHSDLASYVCTFPNCPEPLFESRHQWFNHEMEVHRRQWLCPLCDDTSLPTLRDFEGHANEFHSSCVGKEALVALANQPLQRISAAACPLCNYQTKLNVKLRAQREVLLQPNKLRNHIARHMEHLALFALPKDYPRLYDEPRIEEDDDEVEPPDAGGIEGKGDEKAQKLLEAATIDSMGKALAALSLEEEASPPHILDSAPALALGWQPPHDFTPAAADFDSEDPDLVPRREESMFGGDLFTPGWVRGYGGAKEGYCGRCDVGHWVNIPDGTYEIHLTYMHGLASNGLPLPRPSTVRKVVGMPGSWEAFCDSCQAWRLLRKSRRGWNWFRHCLTEHDTTATGHTIQRADTPFQRARRGIQKGDASYLLETLEQHPTIVRQISDGANKTLLHYAAESGHVDALNMLLTAIDRLASTQEVIDIRSALGATALMLAVGQGSQDIVEILVERKANVNLVDNDYRTALDIAAHAGYDGIAHYLIQHGADMRKARDFQEIYSKYQERQQAAASRKQDLPDDQTQKETAGARSTPFPSSVKKSQPPNTATWNHLMSAVFANDLAGVKQTLHNGTDIESQAHDGRTPLMLAASRSNQAIITHLLEMGANIDAVDNKGWTTLMHAVTDNNQPIVDLLLSRGADANHVSPDHWAALAEAAQHGQTEIMASLLRCGADPESRSSHDWTPLMHCCYKGDEMGVRLLLGYGADVVVGSQHDETPLLLAAAAGHVEIVRILLVDARAPAEGEWARKIIEREGEDRDLRDPGAGAGAGAEVERAYPLGWTPLMVACQGGHAEVVKLLVMAGANLELRSPMEKTALEIAREHGWVDIVGILEGHGGGAGVARA